jgi:hypothetical protein
MTNLLKSVFVLVLLTSTVQAQSQLTSIPVSTQKIPELITLTSSATHLYVLSQQEGLIVFRTNSDTLQYIFSSEGMEQRGHILTADVRFAYQFGQGNRLTVIEPTSLLGVYSSTQLTTVPLAVSRVSTTLFVAMGDAGLGALSLNSPAEFDSDLNIIPIPGSNNYVLDVRALSTRLYVLLNESRLAEFMIDGNDIALKQIIDLDVAGLQKLHEINNRLYVSSVSGDLHSLQSNGTSRLVARFGEPISQLSSWNDKLVARSADGKIYLYDEKSGVELMMSNGFSGNHFAVVNNSLWISTYDILSRYRLSNTTSTTQNLNSSSSFTFEPIPNQIVPLPRSVLIPLVTHGVQPRQVRFQIQSEVGNASIVGNGFMWQPTISQTGMNQFTVTAITPNGQSQSQSFMIDVRSFNAQPRFNPTRPITILVDENFTLPIKAVDPDGSDPDLIRYHGVDLPEGSSISERTGMFSWTPDRRQVGEHEFRVIATDQFGAASSQTLQITVRNFNQN